jgi:hypothetical protein
MLHFGHDKRHMALATAATLRHAATLAAADIATFRAVDKPLTAIAATQ